MKHAGPDALARLAPLIEAVRALPGLTERGPGRWYRGSQAFLHFHDDASGVWADVKLGGRGFDRLPATTRADQAALLVAIRAALAVPSSDRFR